MVAHAPASGLSEEQEHIHSWHEGLRRQFETPLACFLLADMNGRHTVLAEAPPKCTDRGLAHLQHNVDVRVHADPHDYTWVSTAGYEHIIDDIGAPGGYVHAPADVHVRHEFDCCFDTDSRHSP
eukprot:6279474-Karenia_brevis.AAC.1